MSRVRFMAALACAALCLTQPAQAEPGGASATTQGNIGATLTSKEALGVTQEELEIGYVGHSVMWETKQCCLQAASHHGMFSDYCHTPEMTQRLAQNVCPAHISQ